LYATGNLGGDAVLVGLTVDSQPAISPPDRSQVWIDFDGTVTRRDSLDDLIVGYSIDDSWKESERRWQAGEIGSRECLEFEFGLLRISDGELARFLDSVEVDGGLAPLLRLLDQFAVPRAVLSDGIDSFIGAVLRRNGVADLPVYSNSIARNGLSMKLVCPFSDERCESAAAHCKCGSMGRVSQPPRASIYIGDGRSDLCPARRCEVVFAKGALAAALTRENRAFISFDGLLDVTDVLRRHWQNH
jgi:2-hydroxy-3-keto-5-methylthiopentenyl-1-phosphate phosphatase